MTSWYDVSRKLPLVATIATTNNQETIYDCLDLAHKNFEGVIILLDSSSDNTAKEVDKFLRRSQAKNVHVFDTSRTDPWPDANVDPYAKRIAKSYQLVASLSPNSIWIPIGPDLVLNENACQVIRNRISLWSNPEISCSFFNSIDGSGLKKASVFSLWTRGLVKPGSDMMLESLRLYVQKNEEVFLVSPADVETLDVIGSKRL